MAETPVLASTSNVTNMTTLVFYNGGVTQALDQRRKSIESTHKILVFHIASICIFIKIRRGKYKLTPVAEAQALASDRAETEVTVWRRRRLHLGLRFGRSETYSD
jgi:hypothetical protein